MTLFLELTPPFPHSVFLGSYLFALLFMETARRCVQGLVQADMIEEKLGQLLTQLELLEEWQARALAAVDDLLNQKQLRERT